MFKKEFDSSYIGFTTDGARWLAKNTDIKLVGKLLTSLLDFNPELARCELLKVVCMNQTR